MPFERIYEWDKGTEEEKGDMQIKEHWTGKPRILITCGREMIWRILFFFCGDFSNCLTDSRAA